MTFVAIVLIAIPVGLIIVVYMRPVSGHLALKQHDSPWRHLTGTVLVPRYVMAFATTAFLVTGGYMLMPFGSVYTVNNLGIRLSDLATVYLVSGAFTIFTGPLMEEGAMPLESSGRSFSGALFQLSWSSSTRIWAVFH
jgi:predicted MFS family arabinose efflux permease